MHELKIAPFEFKLAQSDAAPGTFEGYGAVFGNVDSYGDVIAKGAFKGTLSDWRKKKSLPKMLLQHGGWGITDRDGIPVGKWEAMEEDDHGLQVKGRVINLDTEGGKSLYGALKEGVLDSMSIGYFAKEFSLGTKPDEPRRTLKKVDLVEVSIVTFPANDQARITAVKSLDDATIREFERALVSGTLPPMTERMAKAFLADGFKGIRSERDATMVDDELAEIIRKNINILSTKG